MAIYSKSQTTVEGLDEIIMGFKKVQEKGASYVISAAEFNAFRIKKKAEGYLIQNSSVKTGKLLKSIRVKHLKQRTAKYSREFVAIPMFTVGPKYVTIDPRKGSGGVNYGHAVELGHKTKSGKQVPAKPYLRPAADDTKEQFIRDAAEAMNAAVEQFGKG